MKSIALHWKILIGMALGVVFGLVLSFVDGGGALLEITSNLLEPFLLIY